MAVCVFMFGRVAAGAPAPLTLPCPSSDRAKLLRTVVEWKCAGNVTKGEEPIAQLLCCGAQACSGPGRKALDIYKLKTW